MSVCWVLLSVISMAVSVPVAQQNSPGTQPSSGTSESSSSPGTSESSSQNPVGFNPSAILALVPGAKAQTVESNGGTYGRRRRSAMEDGVDGFRINKRQAPNYYGMVPETTETPTEEETEPSAAGSSFVLPAGKYGDLARFLKLAGATPSPVCKDCTNYGRKKRQTDAELDNVIPVDEVPVKEVIAEDVQKDKVEVKPHSNTGDQIQPGNSSGMTQQVFRRKFRGGYGRKKREAASTVPPPTVNKDKKSLWLPRKGRYLQIEQTDALAMPRST